MFSGTISIDRMYRAIGVWNVCCVWPGETHSSINKPNDRKKVHTNNLFNLSFVEVISSPHKYDVIRGVFLANHLANTDNYHEHIVEYNKLCERSPQYSPAPCKEARSGSLEPGRQGLMSQYRPSQPAGRPHMPPAGGMHATDVSQHNRLMPRLGGGGITQKVSLIRGDTRWIAQEYPRIKATGQTEKIVFHGSAYPKEFSQQCTTAARRSSAPFSNTVFHSCLATKGSWIPWGGSPSL